MTAPVPAGGAPAPAGAQRWRARNAVVEARQLVDDLRNHTDVAAWIEANGGHAEIPFAEPVLYVETPQGRICAGIGDWVIKGVTGLFFVRTGGVFRADYEPAEASAPDPAGAAPAALAAELEKLAAAALKTADGYEGRDQRNAGYWRGRHDACTACAAEVRALAPQWAALAAEREMPPEVQLAACPAHEGSEHVQVRTHGHWMCALALRGLDDGWTELTAVNAEQAAELSRLREEARALAESHGILWTALTGVRDYAAIFSMPDVESLASEGLAAGPGGALMRQRDGLRAALDRMASAADRVRLFNSQASRNELFAEIVLARKALESVPADVANAELANDLEALARVREIVAAYGDDQMNAVAAFGDVVRALRPSGPEPESSRRPAPHELWELAKGDPGEYRRLLREHGHLIGSGDPGYDPQAPRSLPCGWEPGRG